MQQRNQQLISLAGGGRATSNRHDKGFALAGETGGTYPQAYRRHRAAGGRAAAMSRLP
jgi:hypothetical protein